MKNDLKFYKVREVAEILKLSQLTIYNLIRDDKMECCRISKRKILISESQLQNYIERSKNVQIPV